MGNRGNKFNISGSKNLSIYSSQPLPLNSKQQHSPFTKFFYILSTLCFYLHLFSYYNYFFLQKILLLSSEFLDYSSMSMAMAEAYMARKFHRENMKSITANAATTTGGIEENGGGSGRWFFRKPSTKKNSAKVCDLMNIE